MAVTSKQLQAPKPASFYAVDLLKNWGEYAGPIYHRRNLMVARMLKRFHPCRIVEVAGAEGDLAETILETLASVQSYQWSDFVAEAIPLVRIRLSYFSQILDARCIDADKDYGKIDFSKFDCFVCTSLEHLKRDREIVRALASGTIVALGLPSFDWIAHVRYFPHGFKDIEARYGDLIQIRKRGVVRYNYKRALLMLIKRGLKFLHLLGLVQRRTGLFMFADGPLFPNKLFVVVGKRI